MITSLLMKSSLLSVSFLKQLVLRLLQLHLPWQKLELVRRFQLPLRLACSSLLRQQVQQRFPSLTLPLVPARP